MKKLYFTRHGQTFWNVENKICGATDIALTPLGHEQAVAAGKMIREGGYAIDEILYSPLDACSRNRPVISARKQESRCARSRV